jgi:hypothetical protein
VILGHAYERAGPPGAAQRAWRAALMEFTALGSPRAEPVRDLVGGRPG